MADHLAGVFAPVVTPFGPDGAPDPKRLIDHCRWLLAQDCGLAIFGTNSEGTSLSVEERLHLLDQMIEAGLPPDRMIPGTGACALPDAVRLCAHVAKAGCGGALILPPFYYKNATDDGLYAFFAALIEAVGDPQLRLYLYHIPPVAGIGFSFDLVERLIKDFPTVVVGTKDSSMDDAHTMEMLRRFPGWGVFPGNETNLAEQVKAGAVGVISATCNVNPAAIVDLYRNATAPDAAERQARINTVRATLQRFPMIAAMKSVIARSHSDETWKRLRPPLTALTDREADTLQAELEDVGFRLTV